MIIPVVATIIQEFQLFSNGVSIGQHHLVHQTLFSLSKYSLAVFFVDLQLSPISFKLIIFCPAVRVKFINNIYWISEGH